MKRRLITIGLVVAVFFVVVSTWFAAYFYAAMSANAPETIDANRARLLLLGANLFANDHGGKLPAASHWEEQVLPYLGNTYAMNDNLSSLVAVNLKNPERTVLFFECVPGGPTSGGKELLPPSPRHSGGYIVGFVDLHWEMIDEERLDDLIWQP